MFRSSGFLQFDPLPGTKHFVPWWSLLRCEHDIAAYYAWHTNRFGIEVNVANLWGIHISVVKGEEPLHKELWGKHNGELFNFEYDGMIRFDNGEHAWIDIYSEELAEFRKSLGLIPRNKFHLTIGRLKYTFTKDE